MQEPEVAQPVQKPKDIMSRRIHEPHRLTIIDGAVPNNAHVIGDAQDVMFFIGEVASHGYDDLIAVGAA